jgi:hypothetical protein
MPDIGGYGEMAAHSITALRRKGLPALAVALAFLGLPCGIAQAAARHVPPAARSVTALLIHPYGECSPAAGWPELAANWPMFGTTRLQIETLCSGPVTYAGLVASKAHVLVLSDIAGGQYQLSASEIAAITQYAQAGHNIVATYVTFLWEYGDQEWDNTALAPLFGITPSFATTSPVLRRPDYNILRANSPLLTAVPSPYDSSGYPRSQIPAGGRWDTDALGGARYVAHTAARKAAITLFRNTADHYAAVYISSMPEFSNPSSADLQFLYNALTLTR